MMISEERTLCFGFVSANSEGQEVIAIRTDDILEDVTPRKRLLRRRFPVYSIFTKNTILTVWFLTEMTGDLFLLISSIPFLPVMHFLWRILLPMFSVMRELSMILYDAQGCQKRGMNIWIVSPYRSGDKQENLFNYDLSKYMISGMNYYDAYQLAAEAVTLPGTSEHQMVLLLILLITNMPISVRDSERPPREDGLPKTATNMVSYSGIPRIRNISPPSNMNPGISDMSEGKLQPI